MGKTKFAVIICAVILAVLFSACSAAGGNRNSVSYVPESFPGTMPAELAELQAEFEAAWLAEFGWEFEWGKRERYYGTYGDCIVIFMPGFLQANWTETIAGEEFTHSVIFGLKVFYNGEFLTLEQAYEQGLISKEQVSLIAEYHRNVQKNIN